MISLWLLKDLGVCSFSAFRRLKTALEAIKIAPRAPKKPPRGSPEGPEEVKIIDYLLFFEGFGGLLLFGLPTAQDCPRGHQDRPKSTQEASKIAPGLPKRPQGGPKVLQENL